MSTPKHQLQREAADKALEILKQAGLDSAVILGTSYDAGDETQTFIRMFGNCMANMGMLTVEQQSQLAHHVMQRSNDG